jgi:hypothetical protein
MRVVLPAAPPYIPRLPPSHHPLSGWAGCLQTSRLPTTAQPKQLRAHVWVSSTANPAAGRCSPHQHLHSSWEIHTSPRPPERSNAAHRGSWPRPRHPSHPHGRAQRLVRPATVGPQVAHSPAACLAWCLPATATQYPISWQEADRRTVVAACPEA